jgi:hypothetical protein
MTAKQTGTQSTVAPPQHRLCFFPEPLGRDVAFDLGGENRASSVLISVAPPR